MGTPSRTFSGSVDNNFTVNSAGHEFTVNSPLRIDSVGIFSAAGAAPPSGVTVTLRLASTSASTTYLIEQTFTNASPGTSDASNQIIYKSITPVDLSAGTYSLWAYGYTAGFANHFDDAITGGTNLVKSTIGGLITQGTDKFGITPGPMPTLTASSSLGTAVIYGSAVPTASIIAPEDTDMIFEDILPFTPTDSPATGQDLYQLAPLRYQCCFWTNQDATLVVVTAKGNTRTVVVKAGFRYPGRLKTVKSTGTTASTVVYVGWGQAE